MARRGTCPHCWRGHDRGVPCPIAALTDALRQGNDQRAADAAETTAIRRYLGLTMARDEDAA